jgi:dTDP-glucose 4,6-dehydratase
MAVENVLITGGAGFLGSHLSDLLISQGHKVTAVDSLVTGSEANITQLKGHPNYRFIKADISDHLPPEILDQPWTRIWHMASPASPVGYVKHQITTVKVNAIATIRLLELAEKTKARIFVASTSECYGDPHEHPQTEKYWGNVNPVGMRSMYDEPKRFMEAATMAFHRERGVDTRIVRIFNTYGPRLAIDDGRVVVAFIKQALKNEPMTVQGDGQQTRSLCYVADEIQGFIKLMEHPDYHMPVNIGNPDEVTVLQIAEEIKEVIGSKSQIIRTPLPPDDPKQRCPDISLAKKLLGWEPKVPRKEGLTKTVDFYKKQLGL